MNSTTAWVGGLVAVLLLATCKKDNEEGACFYTPSPRVDLNSWPAGLSWDSTWTVSRTTIPLSVYAVADESGDPVDVKLNTLIVRIQVNATDSILYGQDLTPLSFSTAFQDTVSLAPIPANIEATLSVQTTNGCGYSDVVVRNLLITP
jgi:hypothetical protein